MTEISYQVTTLRLNKKTVSNFSSELHALLAFNNLASSLSKVTLYRVIDNRYQLIKSMDYRQDETVIKGRSKSRSYSKSNTTKTISQGSYQIQVR